MIVSGDPFGLPLELSRRRSSRSAQTGNHSHRNKTSNRVATATLPFTQSTIARTRQSGPQHLASLTTNAPNSFSPIERARILQAFDPRCSVFLVDGREISLRRVHCGRQTGFYHPILTPLIHYHLPELLIQLGRADARLIVNPDARPWILEEPDIRPRVLHFNSGPRELQLIWPPLQGQTYLGDLGVHLQRNSSVWPWTQIGIFANFNFRWCQTLSRVCPPKLVHAKFSWHQIFRAK